MKAKHGSENKAGKRESGPSTVTFSKSKLIERCGIPGETTPELPAARQDFQQGSTRLCMPLLAEGVWVNQFEDLHNTTATSDKIRGRFAACHERSTVLLTSQGSSDNPRVDQGAANGCYLV
ncbi:TPA: hypothetical protein ACH3X2_006985 [Trebouxia sp. C0005]